ncbi:MAG: hypothetical protein HGA44_13015 [Cellulomonadaceae bacterium]|nr:hypothetical protein [Cellulomonadaceae bacterium]
MIGRFLQVDPVPGGSASAYDYSNADPVNCTDLGGTFSWKGLAKAVAVVAETASMFVPGPVGAAVGALAAGAYLAAGDKDAAKMAAIGAAATLVGAGLAVAAVKAARVVKTAQTLGRLATRAVVKAERAVALPAELALKHNAEAGCHVYVGIKNMKTTYVGITNNVARRAAQHGTRFDLLRVLNRTPLTRGEVRAIEQAMIARNPHFTNIRNSIKPTHDYYRQAVTWGNQWLKANGHG